MKQQHKEIEVYRQNFLFFFVSIISVFLNLFFNIYKLKSHGFCITTPHTRKLNLRSSSITKRCVCFFTMSFATRFRHVKRRRLYHRFLEYTLWCITATVAQDRTKLILLEFGYFGTHCTDIRFISFNFVTQIGFLLFEVLQALTFTWNGPLSVFI